MWIETTEVKITSNQILSVLIQVYGMKWVAFSFLGLITIIVLGCFFGFKFFVLALIWLFLFIPLVLTYLYMFYGMMPITVYNAISHKMIFSDKQVEILLPENSQSTTEDDYLNEKENEIDINLVYTKRYDISYEELEAIQISANFQLLNFGKKGLLAVSPAFFNNTDEYKEVINLLSNTIKNHDRYK